MQVQINTKYTSRNYGVGTKFQTHSSGELVILGKPIPNLNGDHFVVEFVETGTQTIVASGELRKGAVKDRLAPTIFGIACIGYGEHRAKWRNKMTKEYTLWFNMLTRCYDESLRHLHPTYADVDVCNRWLNFQNFATDLPSLDGYTKWANNPSGYALDKDMVGQKVYSPKTCVLIPRGDNARFTNIERQSKPFIATRLSDGHEEEWLVKVDFCRHHGHKTNKIQAVIDGKRKHSYGWVFRYKD